MRFFDEHMCRHSSDYKDAVFVFGSNLRGTHGAGAALYARDVYGAQFGIGEGPSGRSYALPTKDRNIESLPLEQIAHHVTRFIDYARVRSGEEFFVTRIGCGLAGYKNEQIAPMFRGAPDNCIFDISWKNFLL
jgi:hypothetical protein